MPRSSLVAFLFEAWNDLDRVFAGLSADEAVQSADGSSSFAWTAAHVANAVDAWLNVRFQGTPPCELIVEQRFRVGGTGVADDWPAVIRAVAQVRDAARAYLDPLSDGDLDLVIPYDGTVEFLHESGLKLRYAVLKAISHHYFHTGEIAAKRVALGHDIGDYPGRLEMCL
jgi:hypothetical protein